MKPPLSPENKTILHFQGKKIGTVCLTSGPSPFHPSFPTSIYSLPSFLYKLALAGLPGNYSLTKLFC